MKAKRIILPDGTIKIEVVKDSLEVIEEKENYMNKDYKKWWKIY